MEMTLWKRWMNEGGRKIRDHRPQRQGVTGGRCVDALDEQGDVLIMHSTIYAILYILGKARGATSKIRNAKPEIAAVRSTYVTTTR
jgi:hypothetical protein